MIKESLIKAIKMDTSLIACTQNAEGTYTWISTAGVTLFKLQTQKKRLTAEEKKILQGHASTTEIKIGDKEHGINSIVIKIPMLNDKNQISGIFSLYLPIMLSTSTPKKTYLTEREIQILSYTLRGKPARAVADILEISVKTVEYHLARIKNKFQCHNKAELIEMALAQGFLGAKINETSKIPGT